MLNEISKVLIIGSEGFIGKSCVNAFKSKSNFKVFGTDLIDIPNPDYAYTKSFANDTQHIELIKNINPDVCIFAAGSAQVSRSISNPYDDFEANTTHVYKLLNSIKFYSSQCQFLHISSAAVYGNPTTLPISESIEPNPISPYGWHKLQAELICKQFSQLYNIKTCSVRPFSVYGPGQRKLLFWDLYQKTKNSNNKPITLFGSGNESRDFIYINDLIQLIYQIIKYASFNGEIYNAGTGEETNILKAAKLFYSSLMYKNTINFNGVTIKGYPNNWQAETKLIESIGFTPRVSLETGIANYVKWLIENE